MGTGRRVSGGSLSLIGYGADLNTRVVVFRANTIARELLVARASGGTVTSVPVRNAWARIGDVK